MQRTLRARMLNKLIYLLNNTDLGSLEYEVKQRNITSEYTLIITIFADKVVDIFSNGCSSDKETLKKQLEQDYDSYLKHSNQFISDEFINEFFK
jgi:hypothetical protein